jgi:hypothetical protein
MNTWRLHLWVEGPSDAVILKPDEHERLEERKNKVGGALAPLIWRSLLRLTGFKEEVFARILPKEDIKPAIAREELKQRVSFSGGKNKLVTGWPRKALIAFDDLRRREPNALVVLVRDRDKTEHPLEQRDTIHQELRRHGWDRAVMGVCVRMVEAWLLADSTVFKTLYGKGAKLPGKPEEEENPKEVLGQILSEYPDETKNLLERFAEIAEQVNLDVLSQKCPSGFGRMTEALGEFIVPCLRK